MRVYYDIEILNAIPKGEIVEGIKYCNDWDDLEGMGIACIAYGVVRGKNSYLTAFPFDDEFERATFQRIVDKATDGVVGFNSIAFDDRLCAINGLSVTTTFDLLREIRFVECGNRDYVPGVTPAGYSLNALALANGLAPKIMDGASAPVKWQLFQAREVLHYCLTDVTNTIRLDELFRAGELKRPNQLGGGYIKQWEYVKVGEGVVPRWAN